jgi:hypothetical protein
MIMLDDVYVYKSKSLLLFFCVVVCGALVV